jgi:hypothetical protein
MKNTHIFSNWFKKPVKRQVELFEKGTAFFKKFHLFFRRTGSKSLPVSKTWL